MPEYVRYDDRVEVRQPEEEKDIADVLEIFGRLRAYTFDKHRHAVRDAHAKSHGILKGELTVYGGLAEPLAQGLFREPRSYPVVVRLSTSPGDILPDGVAAFRGMAIKVFGVDGTKILPEEADALTQDVLLVNHPVIPTGDVSSYLAAARRVEKLAHAPAEAQRILTTVARAGAAAVRAVERAVGVAEPAGPAGVIGQAKPETHILGETFFTMAALRYGDYVAKLCAVPVSEALQPLRGAAVDTGNPSALRDAVVEFFRENEAAYEIRAQLCTDLERMPVEDGSVRWPEEESPYLPVARLTIPAQEAFSPARRAYADDVLTFNPWHCIPEHRPLGSIMRVRRQAYEASSLDRHALNAQPRLEPKGLEEVPD